VCEVAGGGSGLGLGPVMVMVLMISNLRILLPESPLAKRNTDNA
jgi:hypothetical protein